MKNKYLVYVSSRVRCTGEDIIAEANKYKKSLKNAEKRIKEDINRGFEQFEVVFLHTHGVLLKEWIKNNDITRLQDTDENKREQAFKKIEDIFKEHGEDLNVYLAMDLGVSSGMHKEIEFANTYGCKVMSLLKQDTRWKRVK